MALENPEPNKRSFRRGIEEAGAEPRTMSASGTYAIVGLVEMGLDDHTVLLLEEIALALVLFTDVARTDLSVLQHNRVLPLCLLGIGMPLTIALGTTIAALLLAKLTLWEAAIVGTVLASTDAALGQAVVSNPRVPVRVRQALNVVGGRPLCSSRPYPHAHAAGGTLPAAYASGLGFGSSSRAGSVLGGLPRSCWV
jgi:hypothetical protein